ncbi:MAG TPA: alpha/beta hydrolase [Thermoanaerobaculia bacterium]|nr:alpha/beta hydrolase [Thermoanaerobaculia bacterium]
MSQDAQQADITKKAVVYQIAGMDAVTIRRDVEYGAAGADVLTMDIYRPPDAPRSAPLPAVVVVAGFPDLGFQRWAGCKFKEMGSSVSWGRLAAASGMVAVTYTNREPAGDIRALLEYVRQNAASLGIDEHRIGLWASSGNVPLALWALMQEARDSLKCAVLCYGFMLDLDGSTTVAEAAKTLGFANPGAGRPISDLPRDIPLFVVRAGQDEIPHLNETLDRFLAKAVSRNLPITFANHAAAPHAFDLLHDSPASREIIRQILAFMRFHLLVTV